MPGTDPLAGPTPAPAFLQAVWETSADALVLSDPVGVVLAANRAYYALYGLTPDQVLGQDFARIFPLDQRATARRQYREAFAATTPAPLVDSVVQHSDGSRRHVQTRFSFLEQDGRRTAMLSTIRDMTVQRRTEDALRAELAAIVAATSDAVVGATLEGSITSWNGGAERLYGYPRGEAIGRPLALVTPVEHTEEWQAIIARVCAGQPVDAIELVQQHRDGRRLTVSATISPIYSTGGDRVGVATIARDISAAAAAERLRTEFIASLSHDLKSPLTVLRGQLQLLARRAGRASAPEDWLLDGLARLDGATRRTERLLDALTDAARLQAGAVLDLHPSAVDLVALVRDAMDGLRPSSEQHTLVLHSAVPCLVGLWDRDRLERVVGNLLSNALKYSPDGGAVEVSVVAGGEDAEAWAELTVADHGIGIPAAELRDVVQRFRRASNVVGRFPGTGLGLAGATRIVEQHGGTLTVTSVEGEGTTVRVHLPASAPSTSP